MMPRVDCPGRSVKFKVETSSAAERLSLTMHRRIACVLLFALSEKDARLTRSVGVAAGDRRWG